MQQDLVVFRSRSEKVAMWLWGAMALGIAAHIALAADPGRNNVYLKVYARAAEAFLQGAPLYDLDGGFRYPPLTAALFVPFSLCGPRLGSILWRLVNFAVLLLGVRAASRATWPYAMTGRERGTFLVLMALYNNTSLNNGQVNPLILGCMLLATVGVLRHAESRAALAATSATVFKVYPLVLGMVLAALRPRLLVWLLPALALALALPCLVQSPTYVLEQYRVLWDTLQQEDRTQSLSDAYRDLRLVAAASGWTMPAWMFTTLRGVCGAGIVALSLWLRRGGTSQRRVLEVAFSLTMFWLLLLGPATEKATYGFASASLLWPLVAAWRDRGQRAWLAVWVVVNLLVVADHVPIPSSRALQADHPWMRCLQAYAVLLAAVALTVRAVVDGRRARRTMAGQP